MLQKYDIFKTLSTNDNRLARARPLARRSTTLREGQQDGAECALSLGLLSMVPGGLGVQEAHGGHIHTPWRASSSGHSGLHPYPGDLLSHPFPGKLRLLPPATEGAGPGPGMSRQ